MLHSVSLNLDKLDYGQVMMCWPFQSVDSLSLVSNLQCNGHSDFSTSEMIQVSYISCSIFVNEHTDCIHSTVVHDNQACTSKFCTLVDLQEYMGDKTLWEDSVLTHYEVHACFP